MSALLQEFLVLLPNRVGAHALTLRPGAPVAGVPPAGFRLLVEDVDSFGAIDLAHPPELRPIEPADHDGVTGWDRLGGAYHHDGD
ncbi:MAG: hypothetical protein ACRDWH_08525 [Acidimicrobiia bacterium]